MHTNTLKPEREFERFDMRCDEIRNYAETLNDYERIWLSGLIKDYYFETLTGNYPSAKNKLHESKRFNVEFPVPSDALYDWIETDFRTFLDPDMQAFIQRRETIRQQRADMEERINSDGCYRCDSPKAPGVPLCPKCFAKLEPPVDKNLKTATRRIHRNDADKSWQELYKWYQKALDFLNQRYPV